MITMYGFDDIVGQGFIINELKKSLSAGAIYHAYIFAGPEGIGKSALASAFAQGVLCKAKTDRPCGVCDACRRFLTGVHPDYKVIESKKSSIGIDAVREVIEDININPYMSDYKVYIIKNGENMTVQAQNALLKTLEDPPGYAVIIILASNIEKLLPTVVSRCLVYELKPVSTGKIEDFLLKKYNNISHEQAHEAAMLSEGIIGKALDVFNDDSLKSLSQGAIDVLLGLMAKGWDAFLDCEAFLFEHKDDADVVLDRWLDYAEEMACKKGLSQIEVFEWLDIAEKIIAAKQILKRNANYQLSMDILLLDILEVIDNAHSSGSAL